MTLSRGRVQRDRPAASIGYQQDSSDREGLVAHHIGQGVTAGGRRRWRRAAQWTAAAAAVALLAGACGGSSGGKSRGGAGGGRADDLGSVPSLAAGSRAPAVGAASASSSAPAQPMVLSASPADGTKGADPAKGIQINAANGKLQSVTATDASGKAVSGALAADGSSWASTGTLAISSTYTVVAKAQDASGGREDDHVEVHHADPGQAPRAGPLRARTTGPRSASGSRWPCSSPTRRTRRTARPSRRR